MLRAYQRDRIDGDKDARDIAGRRLNIAASATRTVALSKSTATQLVSGRSDQAVATKARLQHRRSLGNDAEIAAAWGAARQVDGKGRFLIPGLWDMHVHFGGGAELVEENKALLPLYVAYGITTVRDCSGDLANDVFELAASDRRGQVVWPEAAQFRP